MKYEQWSIPVLDDATIGTLMDAGYPYLVASVLVSRNVTTAEQAALLLERDRSLSHSPLLMKDMDKAVTRVQRALSGGERIAVFGDYDVDGITATCLLTDFLRSRGGDVLMHIPGRFDEGYGLGVEAIRSLAEKGVKLLITVDCGITGVEETEFANSLGMDVVITDHHECKDNLPPAVAVVDPHRPDCEYPFKHLAGVGVALKLVLALGGNDREDALFARYCTLAAIGTIADVMRMEGENRTIVSMGLEAIDHSDFIGLHALLREAGLAGKPISSVQIGFVLAPRINAAGRMGRAALAAELLLTDNEAEAERLARELCELNRERQSVEQEIYAKAVEQLDTLPPEEKYALVLASEDWHQGVVGIVASRLSEKYSCPSFMIHLSDGLGKGSCRSAGGFNLFGALESCSDLLVGFGGHELAAGFTIEEGSIPAFRKRMNKYVRDHMGSAHPVSSLAVDAEIMRPSLVTLDEVERLSELEPYGSGNDRPVFCIRGALLESMQGVGQNRHLKVRLQKGRTTFEGIFFSVSAEDVGVTAGSRVDAAFYMQVNEFRSVRSVQLQLLDLRPARAPGPREADLLALRDALVSGGELSAKDAARLLPTREQFVRAWRILERETADGAMCEPELPLLRRMAAELPGTDGFARAAVCIEVFGERGLVSLERSGEMLTLRLTQAGKKIELDDAPYLRRLHDILGENGR
ncbi:MAG: single-stranded-DNA-specific exonuclease RecJ [Oscillospiraceae bacterium]|nr:single-stranded-DNA-specific exonuclease RecJ [Oscillospiraceae bacterium]